MAAVAHQRSPEREDELVIELVELHEGQEQLQAEARQYNVACMGRRWGKTVFGVDVLMEEGGLLDGFPCGWFVPTYDIMLEVWDEVCEILSPLIETKNKSEKRIKLITGGKLEFWTLEKPNAGRSRKYKRVIIDEAAMVKNLIEVWDKAISATTLDFGSDAQVWFFSTPAGFDDFRELYQRGQSDDPKWSDWMSWKMPTSSNPHISKEYLEKRKRELPELVYLQEHEAEFVDFSGLLINREMLRVGAPKNPVATSIGVDLAIGTKDIASNAYTAISVMQRDLDGGVYLRQVKRGRWAFNVILQMIEEVAREWQADIIGVEKVQFQDAVVQELLRTTNLPVVGVDTGGRDKIVRFLVLQNRYEKRMIFHDKSLENGEYEEELLTFPNGQFMDMVDATVYAFRLLPDNKHYKVSSTKTEKQFSKKSEHQVSKDAGWGSVS